MGASAPPPIYILDLEKLVEQLEGRQSMKGWAGENWEGKRLVAASEAGAWCRLEGGIRDIAGLEEEEKEEE